MAKKLTAFIGGVHFDRMGKLTGQALQGASNPGIVKSVPGGAGLNTARVARKLGVNTSLCGPVGEDLEAEKLHLLLETEGVIDGLITMQGRQTGSYVSIISGNGDLIIGLNDLALNDEMTAKWVFENCGELLKKADQWFVTANLSRSAVRELIEEAEVPIIAATISQAKAIRFRGVLNKIDLMFTNVKEAQSLLGRQDGDALDLAKVLIDRGVKSGVVSNGANKVSYWAGGTAHELSVPTVSDIMDVTGAGDALAGAMIAGLYRGLDFSSSVRAGINAAAKTIQCDKPVFEGLCWSQLEE